MIIILKNFKRNEICNLTIKSIRHFLPDVQILVLCLYKNSFKEYEGLEKLDVPDECVFYRRSKYTDLGSSVANQYNNLFFSEGYNYIWEVFHDYNGKILLLAEDHFFSTGQTLKELVSLDFDLAYAPWGDGVNGSLLCFNPYKISHAYPIPEERTTVEHIFMNWINLNLSKNNIVHRISTRNTLDYCGDGFYTNTASEIKQELLRIGIIKE